MTKAFTPSSTCLGASTFGQLPTTFCKGWKWSPEDFPLLVLFHPSPVRRAWNLWTSLQCLSPYVSSLIRCTFGMFLECCLSWWDQVILPLLSGKEIKPGLFYSIDIAGPVIHDQHKSLQSLQITLHCRGTVTKCCECV